MTPTPQERWLRVIAALGPSDGRELTLEAMCSAAAELLGAAGVGILVMAGTVPGAQASSSELAAALEELQFTLGAGPRVDAWTSGQPVAEVDLAAADGRWVAFASPAVEAGARGVFSFPLRFGAARVGVLTVYRRRPGPLDPESYACIQMLAEIVTKALLVAQSDLAEDSLARGLAESEYGARVHQASGMVSVQLGVSVIEALARLRARAFAEGATLDAIAEEVIGRRLRFDDR